MIMDYEKKKTVKPSCINNSAITEILWNPGESMIVALHQDGELALYSPEREEPVIIFERQSTGVNSVAWLDNISGDLISSSCKMGALRIWNASNASPKDMIKVGPHGIVNMQPLHGVQGAFILQNKNGEIVVYHARKR